MLSTLAQKLAIPLSFVMSFTATPATKVKSIASEAKRAPVYEAHINVSPTQFAMGDLSKNLTGMSGAITALGTDSTTLLVGSDKGQLNLIHPSGWTEDLTGMLALNPHESARINAVAWNALDSYWLVGGAILEKNSVKPLLVKLMPNGGQSLTLRYEAQKFKAGEITDIACNDGLCVATAMGGKVFTFNGGTLADISNRFGFVSDLTPRVAANELLWMIVGATYDPINEQVIATMYAFDGKSARVVSPNTEEFIVHARPAMAIASNAAGSAWMALANDGALHAWVLDGAEFAKVKGFPKDAYLMPTITGSDSTWVVGGGMLAKNIVTIDKAGAMVPGNYRDMNVSAVLTTAFGTFIAGATGTNPQLIRVK